MTDIFSALDSCLVMPGRDGLRLAIKREGGEYLLSMSRDNYKRQEHYPNRAQAWERARGLGAMIAVVAGLAAVSS